LVIHKFYKYSHFSIFLFLLVVFFFFYFFLFSNFIYKPYIFLPLFNYFFDLFDTSFFPDSSFYYRRFYFFFLKPGEVDILDEGEYISYFTNPLERPYLKLVRYFDFFFGNIFTPSVPVYEKNIREPSYTYIYDLEDFLYFLKENEDQTKLHEFTVLYNNKKLSYFNTFCQDIYRQNNYIERHRYLVRFHLKLLDEKKKKEKNKYNILNMAFREMYSDILRYLYYPAIYNFFYKIYDKTLGQIISPISWYFHTLKTRSINYAYSLGSFHRNYHAGKRLTELVEESGLRTISSRPIRRKLTVTWRQFVWRPPDTINLRATFYELESFFKFNDIDPKYDIDQNPLLKKKRYDDHHIVINNIVILL
jgi:hypothetical protein